MSHSIFTTSQRGKMGDPASLIGLIFLLLAGVSTPAYSQQFNSDSYWTAPHGTQTAVLTVGQEYSTLLGVVSLFPKWEFNVGATLFREDPGAGTLRHFSTIGYVKYMFYENKAKNGGGAIMAGTGVVPGFYQSGNLTSDSKSYWAYVPVTLPLFKGALSWDIMPGYTVNESYGTTKETSTGLLYSTRLALYKVIPQSAIVGEIFGTEGQAYSAPQYRIGVRWESKHVIAALTYSDAFDHRSGARLEFGIMTLSPPFLCFGGC